LQKETDACSRQERSKIFSEIWEEESGGQKGQQQEHPSKATKKGDTQTKDQGKA